MELSIKSIVLLGSVVLTGLSAGLFYAWSVSVIPGTQRISDSTYLETMQSINRAILNPAFFLVFFGSMFFLVVSVIYQFDPAQLSFWLTLTAALIYTLGTVGVTAFGNVPLNDQLDALILNELSIDKLKNFRVNYEMRWNKLHQMRMIFSVLSFILSLLALYTNSK